MFHCRLSAKSLRRSALCALCFAPHLPHMLSNCDSSLWKGRGGAFCSQGPTMARCHTIWLLVPLLERCQFSPLRQGHCGVPAAKTQPVGSLAWTLHCSQADYQQRSGEHSCGHRLPPLRLTDRSLAPVRSTNSASFRRSCYEIWTRFNCETLTWCPDNPLASTSGNASMRCCDAT